MSYTPQNQPPRYYRRKKRRSRLPQLLVCVALVGAAVAALWFFTAKEPPVENQGSSQPESSTDVDAQVSSAPPVEALPSSRSEDEIASSEAPSQPAPPEDDWRLVLVNPTHKLSGDYDVELATVVGDYQLDARAVGDMQAMLAAAKADGYTLQVCSAYRSTERSRILYTNKVNQLVNSGLAPDDAAVEAAKWVAPPGTSEHNTGLAADIVSADYFTQYAELEHDFEKFDEFTWLYENCASYGFILRFPKDKQDITGITYEPWHYRYVGKENAQKIMEQKICLEEYLGVSFAG